jgi:hypothetical protein
MEKSFGNLLRHSRLASYDKTLSQVYTAPKRNRKVGSWGLKRDLPKIIRTPIVTVAALDTSEHQTIWESGESKVLFIRRWIENFPNSTKPAARPQQETFNLASMTPAEFQRFLRQSSKKASAFQQAVQNKEMVPDQVFDYLNVNVAATDSQKQGGIVGPTYSDYQVGWDYPVQGRILNADRQGHAIGVGGIVATLPKRSAIGLRNSGDRRVRTFYVKHAELDSENGKPKVEVSIHPKGATSSIPLLNNFEIFDEYNAATTYQQHDNRRGGGGNRFNNKQDGRYSGRSAQQPELKDNSTPNPEHTELMGRIASLLDQSKDRK